MDEKKKVLVSVLIIIFAKILSPGKKNLFIPTEEYLKLYFYKIIFIFITELNAIKNAWADTAALYLASN
jgi:hypothetical protein